MSIEVEGPDGAIHEFPEGTLPEVMKAALARHYSTIHVPQAGSASQPSDEDGTWKHYGSSQSQTRNPAPISFDDLIPAQKQSGGISFDDLIPPNAAPASKAEHGPWDDYAQQSGPWDDYKRAPSQSTRPATSDLPPGFQSPSSPDELPPGFQIMQPDHSWQARLADNMRSVAHGATFGASPRIAAALEAATGIGGKFGDYSGNLQRRQLTEDAYSKAHPVLSGIGNATGGLASAIAGGSLLGAPAAASELPFLARAGQGAGVGAGLGGFSGAMESKDLTDVPQTLSDAGRGAASGALAGLGGTVAANALATGLGKLGSAFATKPAIPSAEDLQDAARAAYKASEDAGVVVSPQATQRLAQGLRDTMADFGYEPAMQPRGAGVLSAVDRLDGQNATLKGVDQLRRVAGRMREGSPSEAELGRRIVGHIDDFAGSLAPEDTIMGNAEQGVRSLTDARDLWKRTAKSDALANALDKAQNRSASTYSGGNVDNATRQEMRRLLEGPQSWTPDEEAALRTTMEGTTVQKAIRPLGKFSPNGLMGAVELLGAMHNPAVAGLGVAGYGAKKIGDALTQRNVNALGELIRAGGNKSALRPQASALQSLADSKRDALARALSTMAIANPQGEGARAR